MHLLDGDRSVGELYFFGSVPRRLPRRSEGTLILTLNLGVDIRKQISNEIPVFSPPKGND